MCLIFKDVRCSSLLIYIFFKKIFFQTSHTRIMQLAAYANCILRSSNYTRTIGRDQFNRPYNWKVWESFESPNTKHIHTYLFSRPDRFASDHPLHSFKYNQTKINQLFISFFQNIHQRFPKYTIIFIIWSNQFPLLFQPYFLLYHVSNMGILL